MLLMCHIISHIRLVYKFEEEILRCAKLQVNYACHSSTIRFLTKFPAHSIFLKGDYHCSPFLTSVNLQTILLKIRAYGACDCGQVNHPARHKLHSRYTSSPTSHRSPPSRRRRFVHINAGKDLPPRGVDCAARGPASAARCPARRARGVPLRARLAQCGPLAACRARR